MRSSSLRVFAVAASVWLSSPSEPARAQSSRLTEAVAVEVMTAVRDAMAPALPFPASDEQGTLPADGTSTAPWMVRPAEMGRMTMEVLGNPLNEENQRASARAMVQIESAIEAAQRKAESQYERALADVQRTGRSQDIDGITLADEGVAGARIDADSRLQIDVDVTGRPLAVAIAGSAAPEVSATVPGAVAVVAVPAHVYRDAKGEERYCQAERWVLFGAFAPPTVARRGDTAFEMAASVTAAASGGAGPPTLALRLRGNEALMTDVLRRANWPRVRALVRD